MQSLQHMTVIPMVLRVPLLVIEHGDVMDGLLPEPFPGCADDVPLGDEILGSDELVIFQVEDGDELQTRFDVP